MTDHLTLFSLTFFLLSSSRTIHWLIGLFMFISAILLLIFSRSLSIYYLLPTPSSAYAWKQNILQCSHLICRHIFIHHVALASFLFFRVLLSKAMNVHLIVNISKPCTMRALLAVRPQSQSCNQEALVNRTNGQSTIVMGTERHACTLVGVRLMCRM